MSTVFAPIKLTYEDYVHFPEDGRRHELLEGEHVVTPAPSTRHQIILSNLFRILGAFVHERSLGHVLTAPTDVVLSEHDVVQPDLLFVAREHRDRIGEASLEGAPDLVVEIVSESTRRRDEVLKRHLYERHGVGEYWVVDPAVESVKIYRRTEQGAFRREAEASLEAGDAVTSPLFAGLTIALTQLFD